MKNVTIAGSVIASTYARNNYYSYCDKSQAFLGRNALLLPFQTALAEQVVIYAQKSEQGDINRSTLK